MKKTILVCMCFVLWAFIPSAARGEDKPLPLVAVFPTWEPYGYMENDKPAGFEIEIFLAVAGKMGLLVEFRHLPWKRCLYVMANQAADVVISALKVKDREAYIIFPEEPISVSRTALFTAADRQAAYDGSCESIRNYTIGVIGGFSYGPDFDACPFLKKDESANSSAVLAKVLLGRNDLGIDNMAVIRALARKDGSLDKIRFLLPLVHSENLYAAFSRKPGHDRLAERFSKALSEFKASEAYGRILQQYGVDQP